MPPKRKGAPAETAPALGEASLVQGILKSHALFQVAGGPEVLYLHLLRLSRYPAEVRCFCFSKVSFFL